MQTELFFHNSLCNSEIYFSQNYPQARQKFLDAANQLNHANIHQSWQLEKDLTCDSIWLGAENAEKVLVIISGTHGVEGYCGSAVQNFILQAINAGLITVADSTAILLIHALNPWGMQHYRRCDQDGIDLNRNFVDFSQPLSDNPKYLHYLEQLVEVDSNQRYTVFEQFSKTLGQQQFDEIFSGGQYHCNWGPFYGGQKASWSNHVIDQIINNYQLDEKLLVVLDIHSGLGPFAFGELISDHSPETAGAKFAEKLFGSAIAATLAGNSFSVAKRGLLDYRWHDLMHNGGCFLTLEFGSFGTAALFNVILDDHIIWHNTHNMMAKNIKLQAQKMQQHFCPNDILWQQSVLYKSWQAVHTTLCVFSDNQYDHG
ncbi:DUF2817 domain-containing protein [Aliikangiella maris]|uniref:DUF2817 domain-containing protein n=2 Tax=Aliikangiella maris TaxID=3162458 RepID=A0ABV2BZN6_9GAMM